MPTMKNKLAGVYEIINTINNKVYVGSSINIEKRLKAHFDSLQNNTHFNSHLQNAFNLYGKNAFTSKILEIVEDISELRAREEYYIQTINSTDPNTGYNILNYANFGLAVHNSERVRRKISEACSGEKNGMYGKHHTEKSKQKMSQSKLGKHYELSEEAKLRRKDRHAQYKLKKEKENQLLLEQWIVEQHKCECCGKVMTEFYGSGRFCSLHCASAFHNIGREFTDQHREKLSKSRKQYMAIPENNPMYGKHHSDETRKLISDKLKQNENVKNASRFKNHTHTEESKLKTKITFKNKRLNKHSIQNSKLFEFDVCDQNIPKYRLDILNKIAKYMNKLAALIAKVDNANYYVVDEQTFLLMKEALEAIEE